MRGSAMSSNVGGSRNGSVTALGASRSSPLAAGGSTRGSAVSASGAAEDEAEVGPRPPSYASEDGVSYILEAEPRSTAPVGEAYSEIHPAWRPGFAMSEVRAGELPDTVVTASRRV